jgi:1-aminocyclopropane-1-carboxylate deaminase
LQPLLPSPTQELVDERAAAGGVGLILKRDDLIHPALPGNKWRKLKYNLADARASGHRTLLTFGGAYSNHIRAVSAAGRLLGFQTIGIIRGEEHLPLNPALEFATSQGMTLEYLDRETYRAKHSDAVVERLRERFGEFFLIPEGGSNAAAVRGAAELPAELEMPYDVVACAVGTGGTLAGIAAGLPEGKRALGFSSLKGGGFLVNDVRQLQTEAGLESSNWDVELRYHFGGYARRKPELTAFIADFRERHGVDLDWVYVAKMLFGLYDMAGRGEFAEGTTIVAVVTGPATPSTRSWPASRRPAIGSPDAAPSRRC